MVKTSLKTRRKTVSLDRYTGKWVAFMNEVIIASDRTLEDLMKKVKKMDLEKKFQFF